ncbi:putative baseplate assembly protein [Sphaerotilaceae bacterium SBD11-9]
MPLPKPTLDNRSYDQLVAEARAQIPALAPGWTDHNASDPGITLMELNAWLAEQNIYRFDRPSEEAQRAFARLVLGDAPQPAAVAQTVLCLAHGSSVPVRLSPRVQVGTGAEPIFETCDALCVSPARLAVVSAGAPQSPTAMDNLIAVNDARSGFLAFGPRPRAGHALLLGFDDALDAPGATLSLHVWTDSWADDGVTAQALRTESYAQRDALAARCTPCDVEAAEAQLDWRRHYRVRTVWEYDAGGMWQPLKKVVDETRALSLSGFVRFEAPVGHRALGGRYYIRCRIVQGRFECPPQLRHVAINTVTAEHATSRTERLLGRAKGHAGAEFALGAAPVVAGSVVLRLDDGAGGVQADWRTVSTWDSSGPFARDVLLDTERGVLSFGNGLRGEVPADGFDIFASCRVGGGAAGNLPADRLAQVPASVVNDGLSLPPLSTLPAAAALTVRQPFAAIGGAPAEALPAYQARAFDAAMRVDKAVTLDDFERLALATPGLPLASAHAVTGHHPLLPCVPAPGLVQVIVVPRCPRPAPMPSRALLDAVARHLAPRRLATHEVLLVPPRYRRVSVYATLHAADGVDPQALQQRARAALDAFLDPLTGGPQDKGWPLGRTVYRNELLALLACLDGCLRVTSFGLNAPCNDGACCANLVLCAHELVRPGRHLLRVATRIAPQLKRSDAHECEDVRPCA